MPRAPLLFPTLDSLQLLSNVGSEVRREDAPSASLSARNRGRELGSEHVLSDLPPPRDSNAPGASAGSHGPREQFPARASRSKSGVVDILRQSPDSLPLYTVHQLSLSDAGPASMLLRFETPSRAERNRRNLVDQRRKGDRRRRQSGTAFAGPPRRMSWAPPSPTPPPFWWGHRGRPPDPPRAGCPKGGGCVVGQQR